MKNTVRMIVFGVLCSVAGAFIFFQLIKTDLYELQKTSGPEMLPPTWQTRYTPPPGPVTDINSPFVEASKKSLPSVVFIKVKSNEKAATHWFWGDMFHNAPRDKSGSGVIVTKDGYIVTNNHVVEGAVSIEVIVNNKDKYPAKLIGTDRSTDLAVLKVEAENLPQLSFGNSDELQIGEWVLAVGNPFNLYSTVTSGIVSAKARNINIVNEYFPIESFIQTDAAINPGNSGGALVNLRGDLVGINTAIFSRTGAYNGYGFAIPSNLVRKVVNDIKETGMVQRAFMGVDVMDIDFNLKKEKGLKEDAGVYISKLTDDGAAKEAGLLPGDIIVKMDEYSIASKSEFDEKLAYMRPGDKVKVMIRRDKDLIEFNVVLTNQNGTTELMENTAVTSGSLGADFASVSKVEREKLGIEYGVKVFNIRNGKLSKMGIPENFIILTVNKSRIEEPAEAIQNLEAIRGRGRVEGVYPNGGKGVFNFYVY